MDFRIQSTQQTAEPRMEERIVTKTQKGENIQVQNQGNANLLFFCRALSKNEDVQQLSPV